jgi:hypothetical protein
VSQFSEKKLPETAVQHELRAGMHVADRMGMRSLVSLVVVGLVVLAVGCGSGSLARGDGGKSCEQLVSDYGAAVYAGSACTPGAPNQCQAAVPAFLCAGCNFYVNDGTQALAVEKQFFNQGCDKMDATSCSSESCPQAGPFACVAADGGSLGGLCAISPTAATN